MWALSDPRGVRGRVASRDSCNGCQYQIDKVYSMCDGVCLPPAYYFDQDAYRSLEGCWSRAKPAFKVAVERCGCNAAAGLAPAASLWTLVLATMASLLCLSPPRPWRRRRRRR